jgi:hypothetical protein
MNICTWVENKNIAICFQRGMTNFNHAQRRKYTPTHIEPDPSLAAGKARVLSQLGSGHDVSKSNPAGGACNCWAAQHQYGRGSDAT